MRLTVGPGMYPKLLPGIRLRRIQLGFLRVVPIVVHLHFSPTRTVKYVETFALGDVGV